MSTDSSKSPPLSEDLRGALDEIGHETPPDEREFSARLHRRLVAAGPPPAPGWLERAAVAGVELLQELGRDARQKRSLLTGAIIGALATATTFLLLSGGRPLHDGTPAASPDDETADVDGPNGPNGPNFGPADRKAQRAVGDRRLTRDRLADDIGAERPERARGAR